MSKFLVIPTQGKIKYEGVYYQKGEQFVVDGETFEYLGNLVEEIGEIPTELEITTELEIPKEKKSKTKAKVTEGELDLE